MMNLQLVKRKEKRQNKKQSRELIYLFIYFPPRELHFSSVVVLFDYCIRRWHFQQIIRFYPRSCFDSPMKEPCVYDGESARDL